MPALSFATVWSVASQFRSSSNIGRNQITSACLKSARSGSGAGPPERARPAVRSHHESALCGSLDQSKLRQGRHAIVEADLLDNLAVLELQDGRTGELHLAPRVGGQ